MRTMVSREKRCGGFLGWAAIRLLSVALLLGAAAAPADRTDPLLMARFNDGFIFWLIKKGRITAAEEKNFDVMKPSGHVMTDEEIWSVVKYVRETYIDKGNE